MSALLFLYTRGFTRCLFSSFSSCSLRCRLLIGVIISPLRLRFGGCFAKADDHYTMQDEDLSAPRRIEFCTGSFMAVRTDVFKEIGGFDPAYFMYVEDADLTQKVLQKGTVWLAPQFSAIHAWHRAPMRDAGKFKMQLVSMGRYFKKWGCGKGKV